MAIDEFGIVKKYCKMD